MKLFHPGDDKAVLALMGAQYALSGAKSIIATLGPILTAAQIGVAIVTIIWIWRRAQGQHLANKIWQNKGRRKKR